MNINEMKKAILSPPLTREMLKEKKEDMSEVSAWSCFVGKDWSIYYYFFNSII